MATVNVVIENGGWQDLETLGSLTLENGKTYSVAFYHSDDNEVAIADSQPSESLRGNPVRERQNFNFTYTSGDKIWVKVGAVRLGSVLVVLT